MKRMILIFVASLLSGCVTIKYPKPLQVEGIWESVNLSYARMELDQNAEGSLVYSFPEGEPGVYKISGFRSKEHGFSMQLEELTDSANEVESVNGTVYENGSLCLRESDVDDLGALCFMKVSNIERSRKNALRALKSLNDKLDQHDTKHSPLP